MLCSGLMLAACGAREVRPAVAQPMPHQASQPTVGLACQTEGCCRGHGNVAYVQPDKLVMCTDGEPSEICDCH